MYLGEKWPATGDNIASRVPFGSVWSSIGLATVTRTTILARIGKKKYIFGFSLLYCHLHKPFLVSCGLYLATAPRSSMKSPLTTAIAAQLVERIQDGRLRPGQPLPSERELSIEFGASRGVIRAAISELALQDYLEVKPRCRPTVVLRKRQARSLVSGKSNIAIWLWPNTGDYAAASILKGIQSADIGNDFNLVVANAGDGDWDSIFESESKFLMESHQDPQVAGLIIWYLGGERNLPALRSVRESHIPIVFVDRQPPTEFCADFVGTHNEGAAQRAVQHLIELGHRQIALLSNIEPVSSVRERESGYSRALREAGIPFRPEYIIRDQEDGPEGVDSLLDQLLSMDVPPTAIFAVNDHIALQVCDALRERKIAIPNQMSVIGFDGLLRWVPGGGHLTTSLQDFERIGRLAAELVYQRMGLGTVDACRHILLDAPLLVRGTTAPPTHFHSSFHSSTRKR